MSYCNKHRTNNCIECAIEKQTDRLIKELKPVEPEEEWESCSGTFISIAAVITLVGMVYIHFDTWRWPW